LSGRAFWIKFTLFVPYEGEPLAEVWAILFDLSRRKVLGIKEEHPLSTARFEKEGGISVGSSLLSLKKTTGRVTNPERGFVSWDLSWESHYPPLVLFPYGWMYSFPLPKSKTVTPYPHLLFSGTIESPLGRWDLIKTPGCQGHNWGKEHTYQYAWVHGNTFRGREGVVFEGVSAQVRVLGRVLPPLTLGILLLPGGGMIPFHRFSSLRKNRGEWGYSSYRFTLVNRSYRLEGEGSLDPSMTAGLTYRNPDGEVGYCLNSKTSSLTLTLYNREGRVVDRLESENGSALEILTRSPDHPVQMIL
jgi:hypothetical protein